MGTEANGLGPLGDAALISATRTGHVGAYAELVGRHRPAMRRLQRVLDPLDLAGDLTGDALALAYTSLTRGHGPAAALRPYLLMLVRQLHRVRAAGLVSPMLGDEVVFAARPFADHALRPGPRQALVRAFAALPEGWQVLLWHLEAECDPADGVARLLGVPTAVVPPLAVHAREALALLLGDGTTGRHAPELAEHLLGDAAPEYLTLARAGSSIPGQRVALATVPAMRSGSTFPEHP